MEMNQILVEVVDGSGDFASNMVFVICHFKVTNYLQINKLASVSFHPSMSLLRSTTYILTKY